MPTAKAATIALLLTLIGAALAFTPQEAAAGITPIPGGGCTTYDFAIDEQGWYAPEYGGTPAKTWATYDAANDRWAAAWKEATNDDWWGKVLIGVDIDANMTLTRISANYSMNFTYPIAGSFVRGHHIVIKQTSSWMSLKSITDELQMNDIEGSDRDFAWTGEYEATAGESIYIELWHHRKFTSLSAPATSGHAYIYSVEICQGEQNYDLIKPHTPPDMDSWGITYHDGGDGTGDDIFDRTIFAYSTQPAKPVYAPFDGTIIELTELTVDDCYRLVGFTPPLIDIIPFCGVEVPGNVNGTGDKWLYQLGNLGANDALTEKYRVVVYSETLGLEAEYFVSLAEKYIAIDQTVSANCIIGESMKAEPWSVTQIIGITGIVQANSLRQGVTWIQIRDAAGESLEKDVLHIDPVTGNACNKDPEHRNCIGDSALNNPSQWDIIGDATITSPGADLHAWARIQSATPFNLDPTREPQMKVSARSYGGASMELQLGETTQEFEIDTQGFKEYVLTGAAHTPDQGDYFTVAVENTSEGLIEIEYICISFTLDEEGEPEPDPNGQCVFLNYDFEDGKENWTTSSGVTAKDGSLLVPGNGTFEQNITLYLRESAAVDYKVSVRTSLEHYEDYVPDTDNTTAQWRINYDFPANGDYEQLGSNTSLSAFAKNFGKSTFNEVFNIAAQTSGVFRFQVIGISMDPEIISLRIERVCIEPNDGGDMPNPDDGTPEPEPFPANCEIPKTRPSGSDVGEWINWHWANLDTFFQCDLMVFLNKQYQTITSFFNTTKWAIRWSQDAFRAGITWGTQQFIPWLGGHLSNAAGGNVYYAPEEQCDWWNILCHLTRALDIGGELFGKLFDIISLAISEIFAPIIEFIIRVLTAITDLFFTVLEALVALAFMLMAEVIRWLALGRDVFYSLIAGWNNSAPVGLPGISPECAINPQTDNSVICWIIWTADNTIFSGAAGSLIIPLMVSWGWIMLAIYFVGEIKAIIQRTGESL